MNDLVKAFLDDSSSELTMFLQTLFGQATGFIELRKLHPKVEQRFIPISHVGFKLVERYIQHEAWSTDVYFGVHPRTKDDGSAEAVERCFVLLADFDTIGSLVSAPKPNVEANDGRLDWYVFANDTYLRYQRPPVDAIVTQLKQLQLMPSIIVDSGKGYHFYWLLPHDVPADEWKFLQAKLLTLLSDNLNVPNMTIDNKLKDLPRILRVPNTINSKVRRTAKIIMLTDRTLSDFQIQRIRSYQPANQPDTAHQDPNEPDDLKQFEDLAFQLLAPAWKEGQRNELTFYWAGFCKKNGVPIDSCKRVVERLQATLGDDQRDVRNRFRRIEETYIKDTNVKGFSGLLQLGVNLSPLQSAANSRLQQKKNEKNKSKLQKFFELFQQMYTNLIFKTEADTRTVLFLWNGKFFEALTQDRFDNIFLRFTQETLDEVTTTYYSQHVYNNLTASSHTKIIPSWKPVIAFNNTTLNLNTLTTAPHAPEHGNRFAINANFIQDLFYQALQFDDWTERFWFVINQTQHLKYFIESLEMNDTLVTQIVELGGYIMLPRIKRFNLETAFILYGSGANGKSTLLAIIQHLFNGFYSSVSLSELEGFSLATLIGKYLNIANEITEKHDKTVALENLKRTVSWDKMEIPIKHQPHLIAELPIIHIFAVNSKPRTEEATEAAFRRFCFLDFHKTIPVDKRDPNMLDKLLQEIDTIATLFALGAVKITETNRITNNEELQKSTILDNNPLVEWLAEHFEPVSPKNLTSNPAIYAYKLNDLRKDFNEWFGRPKFNNNDTFSTALRHAIDFLANNDHPDWAVVRILKDTKHTPGFENTRILNVAFPLHRKNV